jgi:hypothetical protein
MVMISLLKTVRVRLLEPAHGGELKFKIYLPCVNVLIMGFISAIIKIIELFNNRVLTELN